MLWRAVAGAQADLTPPLTRELTVCLPGCEDMSKDRKQKTAEISERRVVAWGEAAEGLTGAASWRRRAGRP